MTRQEHLLTILAEECNEVAQRISKALRFGLDEMQHGQFATNRERIAREMADLLGLWMMLQDEARFPELSALYPLAVAKVTRVEKWLDVSQTQGTLS